MMRSWFFIVLFWVSTVVCAQSLSLHDCLAQQPQGWCTMEGGMVLSSDTSDVVVLRSDGGEMGVKIREALLRSPIVILDGKNGPFRVDYSVVLFGLHERRLIGVNGATLTTSFVLSEPILQLLNDHHVKDCRTNGGGFVLSNSRMVREECEAAIRQLLIDSLRDNNELYTRSGIFKLQQCSHITIQNIAFCGPGAVDVGGDDLLTISDHCHHIWVDHCSFQDGMDGNLDINHFANLITLSNCSFGYSSRSYIHMNCTLIGSSDNADNNGADCLNTTFLRCHWQEGCDQRMPMARFGTVHLYDCTFSCPDATCCVNARKGCSLLMENCRFAKGIKKPFVGDEKAEAWEIRNCRIGHRRLRISPKGSVTVLYQLR